MMNGAVMKTNNGELKPKFLISDAIALPVTEVFTVTLLSIIV